MEEPGERAAILRHPALALRDEILNFAAMGWHIEDAVIRGEIDNRTRGRVTGRVWLAGCAEPIMLDLQGNAWRDLAGRGLTFVNPKPPAKPLTMDESVRFGRHQRGPVGDITASRRVKIAEVPPEEVLRCMSLGQPYPWHWGNSLCLEWYDETNGRVVIESAKFQLTVSADIAWDLTAADEAAQRRANDEALSGFVEEQAREFSKKPPAPGAPSPLDQALDPRAGESEVAPAAPDKSAENDWRNFPPQTEAEAEAMQAESERLAERIEARLRRAGPDADYEKILTEELAKRARERGEETLAPEEVARRAEWMQAMNELFDASHGKVARDWDTRPEWKHPLATHAFEFARQVGDTLEATGKMAEAFSEEHPLLELRNRIEQTAVKLAASLNGYPWPPDVHFCASVIVMVKRARAPLDDALHALEVCQEHHLLTPQTQGVILVELIDLIHDIDALLVELRGRLARGA